MPFSNIAKVGKLSLLIFEISSLLLLLIALPKVIALLLLFALRKRATTIAIIMFGRAIAIWEKKRSHGPIYKVNTKNYAKRLGAATFTIKKLKER